MHQTKARKRERKHAHIKYSSRTSLRLLLFPLPARQPSARHNPFAPHRSASRRAGDSSGSQRGREGGRRKKRAGKPREAGATTATLPHSSPRLPPPPPSPARRRGAPGRADLLRRPAPSSGALLAVSVAAAVSPPSRARFLVGWAGNGPGAGSPPGTRRCRWLLDLLRVARPRP